MNKFILSILFTFLIAQRNGFSQETNETLDVNQLIELLVAFHPIVGQTNIQIQKAKAEILHAKGNFDPTFNSYNSEKNFDGTNYYNDFSSELKIPTWYGVDLSAGLNNLAGTRNDPSESFGKNGFLAINIPLVKNLVFDKRRAVVQQSKVMKSLAENQQKSIVNDLLMEAIEAYWAWVKAFETYKIFDNNVQLNENRTSLIKKSFFIGERSAIDTIEAISQLQYFQNMRNEYWLRYQNATLHLSVYLWTKDNKPFELPSFVTPKQDWSKDSYVNDWIITAEELTSKAMLTHPSLMLYNNKMDVLNIEKKLKKQDLLPKVDLKYALLNKGYTIQNTFAKHQLFQDNYQLGLKIEMPLFLSQGRANLKIANLKIEENQLDIVQKQREIELKIKQYYNEFSNLKNQVLLQENLYNNYYKLLQAEQIKYDNGESTLFLINSRETKTLDAQEKLIEIKTKYFKSFFSLKWSAGMLVN